MLKSYLLCTKGAAETESKVVIRVIEKKAIIITFFIFLLFSYELAITREDLRGAVIG